MENQLTHQQRQAFKCIELISLWEGRSNTTHLMKSLELINAATVQRLGSSHQHPNPAHVRPIIQAIQRQQRLDIRLPA